VTPLFAKLNLGDRRRIVVLNAPAEFEPELAKLAGVETLREVYPTMAIEFGLAFAQTRVERDAASAALTAEAADDAVLWIAYPKASSRRYACDFNRDSGWETMQAAGFDSVRMIAIDADWSALRFRRAARIRRA
jgi:hypothetical protein